MPTETSPTPPPAPTGAAEALPPVGSRVRIDAPPEAIARHHWRPEQAGRVVGHSGGGRVFVLWDGRRHREGVSRAYLKPAEALPHDPRGDGRGLDPELYDLAPARHAVMSASHAAFVCGEIAPQLAANVRVRLLWRLEGILKELGVPRLSAPAPAPASLDALLAEQEELCALPGSVPADAVERVRRIIEHYREVSDDVIGHARDFTEIAAGDWTDSDMARLMKENRELRGGSPAPASPGWVKVTADLASLPPVPDIVLLWERGSWWPTSLVFRAGRDMFWHSTTCIKTWPISEGDQWLDVRILAPGAAGADGGERTEVGT